MHGVLVTAMVFGPLFEITNQMLQSVLLMVGWCCDKVQANVVDNKSIIEPKHLQNYNQTHEMKKSTLLRAPSIVEHSLPNYDVCIALQAWGDQAIENI